ncbi:MAG: hypothetical protein QXR45_11845 [Candidatus Bathyarchaeia archaeon]
MLTNKIMVSIVMGNVSLGRIKELLQTVTMIIANISERIKIVTRQSPTRDENLLQLPFDSTLLILVKYKNTKLKIE